MSEGKWSCFESDISCSNARGLCFALSLTAYSVPILNLTAVFSYVYLGENGTHRMPAEPQPNVLSAKFVRGFLSVVEAAPDSS